MSDLPKKTNAISDKVIDLIVSNTLSKNGVDLDDVKGKISAEEKQLLKELVEELTLQVDQFVDQSTSPKKDSK
ncbi:spore coat protein [Sporosarcina sp. FSL K6-2383]|uniref:spore coat protein n=1 Tax=Sporosarcina sp. FSL K6-2383 TaxID=2921556 RepID=UPI00315AE127